MLSMLYMLVVSAKLHARNFVCISCLGVLVGMKEAGLKGINNSSAFAPYRANRRLLTIGLSSPVSMPPLWRDRHYHLDLALELQSLDLAWIRLPVAE